MSSVRAAGVGANYRLAGKHGSADASVPPQIADYNLFVYARPLYLRTVCKYESRRNTEKKDDVTLGSEPVVVSRSLVEFVIAQEGIQWCPSLSCHNFNDTRKAKFEIKIFD